MAVNLRPQAGVSCSPDDLGFGAIDTALRLNAPDPADCRVNHQNGAKVKQIKCGAAASVLVYIQASVLTFFNTLGP